MFGLFPFLITLLASLALTAIQNFSVAPPEVVDAPTPDKAIVNQVENVVDALPEPEPESEPEQEIETPARVPAQGTPTPVATPAKVTEAIPVSAAKLTAPIRVHIIASDIDYLDAASIYTENSIRDYIASVNEIFAQANVVWSIESIVVERLLDDQAVDAALTAGTTQPARALSEQVNQDLMLDPYGWDLYVIRKTVPFGFGGVYTCNVDGPNTAGAAFVPLLSFRDTAQEVSRWAHELGHATGLRHPACEEAYADNLMMSGTCGYRIVGRIDFDADEIAKIQTEVKKGKAGCF